VARFGNDKTVFVFRQGRVALRIARMGKLDTVAVYSQARDQIRAFRGQIGQIAVDTIGLGAGVADMLRADFGEIVVDVNSAIRLSDGQNYNLRARMWSDMREWLKAGASIPNDGDLITDLTALRYLYKGGELLIESKDDAKKRGVKSPDNADALALTFAYPVKKPDEFSLTEPSSSIGWRAMDELTSY
jgi:hypothetical protein